MINYRYGEQILDILPQLIISLISGGAVFLIGKLDWNLYLLLLLQLTTGVVLYLGLAKVFRLESYRYVIQSIHDYRNHKRNVPHPDQEG